ncbi:hypothetical protein QBC39DRAFT_334306 [Podospora conica]|nr:hypothetical protein QBC39DRAFT_334306 [Schizothecium conicum]
MCGTAGWQWEREADRPGYDQGVRGALPTLDGGRVQRPAASSHPTFDSDGLVQRLALANQAPTGWAEVVAMAKVLDKDMSVKGAKTRWWEEREALDLRLKDLLENIEQIWLSGSAERRPRPPPSTVTLDPRILDLFIGLGDSTAPGVDFDDELTDLLYFVVDILSDGVADASDGASGTDAASANSSHVVWKGVVMVSPAHHFSRSGK